MATQNFPHDRFDDVSESTGRIGAHRAENPRLRGWILFLWAVIATIVLVVVGIVGTMIISGRFGLFPESSTPPTAVQTTASVVDTSYSVLVLNATPQTGLAAAVKDVVVAAGWSAKDVYPSDAGSKNFATTTVYYVDAADEAAARGLAQVIGGADVVESSQYRTDPAAKQLTIVLGLDRTSAAATP